MGLKLVGNTSADSRSDEDSLLAFLAAIEENASKFPKPSVNLLQAAKLGRQEIRHTNLLAFFLDPIQAHGLGDELLKQLLEEVGISAAPTGGAFSRLKRLLGGYADLQVRREMMNIDIVAWSDESKFVLAIEAKIDAVEGQGQLPRYKDRLLQEFPGYEVRMLFLTTGGSLPADEAWTAITWGSACSALKTARKKKCDGLSNAALFAIDQYLEFMHAEIVVNQVDEEFVKVCRELYTRHRRAIDLINEYGAVSPFADAAHAFRLSEGSLLQSCEIGPKLWAFLPSELAQACEDKALFVAPGAPYWAQNKALIMWFAAEDKKLALILEVGPWEAPGREALIEALRQAAPDKGHVRGAITRKFSRIWSARLALNEEAGSDEMAQKMRDLLNQVRPHIPALVKVVRGLPGDTAVSRVVAPSPGTP